MADTAKYAGRIAWQHRDKPRFTATVEASVQPFAQARDAAQALALAFDLDTATGAQLDAVGVRVGRSRFVETPIEGVFFSLDTSGLGFDAGIWRGPFDALTGLLRLPDPEYRTLLRAKVTANQWDGTLPDLARVLAIIFAGTGLTAFVADGGDMTMTVCLIGPPPGAVLRALLTGGYLAVKPMGVRVAGHRRVPAGPHFGFDQSSALVAGFDAGAWGQPL